MMNEASSSAETELAETMWSSVCQSQDGSVTLSPIKRLVHAVLGTNPAASSAPEKAVSSPHKQFYQFYLNRIAHRKTLPSGPTFSHIPAVDKNSSRIMANRKIKALGGNTVEDMMETMWKDRQLKFREYKLKVEATRTKECTFRPKILPSGVCSSGHSRRPYSRFA